MKNLILLVMCILVSTVTFAGKPKKENKETFELQGYYLDGSNVSYEVFEVTNDSWELVASGKSIRCYNVELKINSTYVMVFKKDNKNKILYVDVQHPGIIDVDIDFKYKQDATLKYTKGMDKYQVKVINLDKVD